MILQALTAYYESLVERGELSGPGWNTAKVSFALCIDDDGELRQVESQLTEQARGNKTVLRPREIQLPTPVKRSVNVAANFLCDKSSYIFGADNDGITPRNQKCFEASRELHERVLQKADSPAARALKAFFEKWEPEKAHEHPAIQEYRDELLSGVNMIFRYNGKYVHEDPAVRQAWQSCYNESGPGPEMPCLVTGQTGPVAQLHPSVKGIPGAQSSGASLVSFNVPSSCSFGREQGYNAPTGVYAAFAYGAALNYLASRKDSTFNIGNTTVLFWAEGGAPVYQIFMNAAMFGASAAYSNEDLRGMIKALAEGEPVVFQEEKLSPDTRFYILGLSPNAARLSVSFFMQNSFGNFLKNIQAHYDRLEIVRPAYDKFETIPVWKLLSETVNQNAKDKNPSSELSVEVISSILNNTLYPATLLNGVTMRIRAERNVTRGRAAIIKAYYTKLSELHTLNDIPKEVLTVSLNSESANVPYALGRMFSVLEAIQSSANPEINSTIKDKYFNSAAATPATIFPILINLAQKHLKKLSGSSRGSAVFYEKQLGELSMVIGQQFPERLNLPQQGAFQLGYYHQTQERYRKSEKRGGEEENE